jgi:DNA-binding Xre family transcriptional regulator
MNTKKQITENNCQITAQELAKLVVIKGENTSKFIEFSGKVLSELGPQTEIEKTLCEKFIILSWKLRRLLEVERNTFNKQSEVLSNAEDTRLHFGKVSHVRVRNLKKIDISDPDILHISKYQIELEKRIAKTLVRLREEQDRNTQNKDS